MIHPDTKLAWISEEKGWGVIATSDIPAGTITYVQDLLDIVIEPGDPRLADPRYSQLIEKYSFIDRNGHHVLSWDYARFVNHCCFPNTLTTGYGFEIAIKDIKAGEEITDDYGLFTTRCEMNLDCPKPGCRKRLDSSQFEKLAKEWDREIRGALDTFRQVAQPLLDIVDEESRHHLQDYFKNSDNYLSVLYQKPVEGSPGRSSSTKLSMANPLVSRRRGVRKRRSV